MKKIIKSTLGFALVLVMMLSSLIIVSAEQVSTSVDDSVTILSASGGTVSPQAYELIWKFQKVGTHLYKRRWNMTLGAWYDPAWILVY